MEQPVKETRGLILQVQIRCGHWLAAKAKLLLQMNSLFKVFCIYASDCSEQVCV